MSLPATRHTSIGQWLDSQLRSGSKPSPLSIPRRFPSTLHRLPPDLPKALVLEYSPSSGTPWIQVGKLPLPPALPLRRRGTSRRPSIPRAESNTRLLLDWKILRSAASPVPRQTDLRPCSHVVAYMLLPSKGVPFERVDPEFRSGWPIAARCYFYAGQRYTYLGMESARRRGHRGTSGGAWDRGVA